MIAAIGKNVNIMEFMVFIVELAAENLFMNDKYAAYNALTESGLWNFYIDTYDTTHSLGEEALLDEMIARFGERGFFQ